MEYLTKENLTLALMVLMIAWEIAKQILRWVAPRTETKIDDNVLAAMTSAQANWDKVQENQWIREYGPGFWAQVEALSLNTGLKGFAKLCYFLTMAHKAYAEAHQKALSLQGVKSLELLASSMSATAKLPLNPLPAPVSK